MRAVGTMSLTNSFRPKPYAIVQIRAARDRAGNKTVVATETSSGTKERSIPLLSAKHFVMVFHHGAVSSSVILIMVATIVMCIRLAVRKILIKIMMPTKSRLTNAHALSSTKLQLTVDRTTNIRENLLHGAT